MTPQKMTPQTPSGRFCLKMDLYLHFLLQQDSLEKRKLGKWNNTHSWSLLAQESKKRDIWPEAESFIRKISGTVHEVVHVPRVFDYTNEETMYCIELKDLLKKYQEKPAVKILQMPAISLQFLKKLDQCGINEAESRAIRSRMIEFKASSGPNFLEILKTCFPEIRRYENGRDHLDKVHHVKKERKRVHQKN
ncbi:hypothetical protein B9Z55_028634 [Caenorhabditis nigoni]|uniref:Uncharacterized protein n=1 Tax=Caenorhabditis nigoni TaxID=1611254 RepID=A0A2G5SBA9_9PELO|nr:hypothetical protein B9Z55_028634 [Caenorhabditis nigoni]